MSLPWILISYGDSVPPVSQDGQTILMPGKSGPSGSSFSRKRYEEIRAAERARIAALEHAHELRRKKDKKKVEAATIAAQEAIEAIELAGETAETARVEADLVKMTLALEASAHAANLKETLVEAARAMMLAKEIMAYVAELQDDEDAIALLLH